ncbi:MAG: iduronate-2-sulfatase [Gammaproteobacteria bacterium]|nr:iduronate-2-sulfatase [Gammaproteobacteria bacterium]
MTDKLTSIRWILAFILGLSTFSQAQERPDILFIAIDDMNDWVEPLGGHPQAKTPNINALAERGMLFTNAHAPGAACLPSRTAILTGVSPFNSGIYEQAGDWRIDLENITTLPRYFRDNDYRTLGGGKLFHAHTYSLDGFQGQQDTSAWDAYFPSLERQLVDEVRPAPGQTPGPAVGNGRQSGDFDFYPVVVTDSAMGDGQTVSWISRELEAAYTGPRFISAGIYRPHLPWYVPQRYFDMHPLEQVLLPEYLENDTSDIPDSALFGQEVSMGPDTMDWVRQNGGTGKWQEAVQGYLASMSYSDAMVGELIAALDRSGRADNTIIVLWSDHGFHLGEKERWGKMTLWEESSHVPFIIVAPGITTPGSSTDEVVSLQSIYATLAELSGLEVPEHVDGNSLLPLLRNPDMEWDDVATTTFGYGNFAVRGDRYRYVVYSDGEEELYDHANDPNEWNNLANDPAYQEIKSAMAGRLPPRSAWTDEIVFPRGSEQTEEGQ